MYEIEESAMVTAIHQTPRVQRKEKNTRMIACSRQSADLARTEAHLPVIRSETARCFADPRIVTSLVYFIVPHSASIVRRLCTPTNTEVLRHCAEPRIYARTHVSLLCPIPYYSFSSFPPPNRSSVFYRFPFNSPSLEHSLYNILPSLYFHFIFVPIFVLEKHPFSLSVIRNKIRRSLNKI